MLRVFKRFSFISFLCTICLSIFASPLNGSWYENTLHERSRLRHYFYRITDDTLSVVNKKSGTETFYSYRIIGDEIQILQNGESTSKIIPGRYKINIKDENNFTVVFPKKSMSFVRNSYAKDQADRIVNSALGTAVVGMAVLVARQSGEDAINKSKQQSYPTNKAYKKMKTDQDFLKYQGESNGARLASNLQKAGIQRPKDFAAHHIVPKKSTTGNAEISRQILEEVGIDLDDPRNGVFLPTDKNIAKSLKMAQHYSGSYAHQAEFQAGLAERLMRARGSLQDVEEVVNDARQILLKGKTW